MKILINLATLKNGGGQNVGLNFVKCLIIEHYDLSEFLFVVSSGSLIEEELSKCRYIDIISVSKNPLKRMAFELFRGKKIIKKYNIDIIYTLFGLGLYPKCCLQVSGSADSNIFFPDINFWEGYTGFSRIKKIIVDKYRIYALRRAHSIIFENELILEKAIELFQLENVFFSKPSINPDFPCDPLEFPFISSEFKIGLFFCSWQKNKNYMLIPEILHEFKNRGIKFHIVITAPKSDLKSYNEFILKINSFNVSDLVTVLGPVKKTQIKALYEKADYVFLLSKLESFSNNIIESWFFKKVLVISDEKWANAICKEGALYVDRDNPLDIVEKIQSLERSSKQKSSIIAKGNQILKTYPSIKEKVELELKYIRSLHEFN
ncbi:glycosyltransferase involved in cell wall biosynthesis [Algoriphagus aquaeductus]|uniref:Glycosyltransferase involved in cell wall biosynthesis n=1 Tax=Algoriphagus aquaeductus TaxID=475299 RepID=A0A326RPH5_9BACT|nr:glycosyltransferase [Algoriphagus aquaeductus]PZV81473.1 glycosyltransferase involved in cell wall biosynthesis [Algoriphagus aquaeductus]